MDKITYLMKYPSATSYVATTFHPTIGQRAPQSISNAATPEPGMILQGIRELAGLHIARDIQNAAKPTQLGLSGHQGVRERLNAKLVSSLQSQEHLHQN